MARKILIIDDDEDILELLTYNLEKEGYEIKALNSSTRAIHAAKKFLPDLIILDIMMPGKNGIEICRKLRTKDCFQNVHIFFLTAHAESYFQHAVFHTGGDEFIEKIVGIKSLTKKIGAVLKRDYIIRKSELSVQLGNLTLNRTTNSLTDGIASISLSKPEFDLLFFFAQNHLREIPVEHIVQTIWGSDTFVGENNIETYITNIERKAGITIVERRKNRSYRVTKALRSGIHTSMVFRNESLE
jgi:two-component system alkaline phosphatase synthesis response regulator PhoP